MSVTARAGQQPARVCEPGLLLVVAALPSWDRLRTRATIRRALAGTNAAVVGLLAAALYTPLWTGSVTGPLDVGIVAAGLALLVTGRAQPVAVVALAAAAGQLATTVSS